MGKVALHPNQRICEAIRLVFVKFRERRSVRQTFRWFRDHDIELPANPIQGTRLVWKIPTQSLVRDILINPFYAGTYVWGRRPVTALAGRQQAGEASRDHASSRGVPGLHPQSCG